MDFSETIACLSTALHGPLPGVAAHGLMAPRPRASWPKRRGIRHAAGLLLVFPYNGRAHIVVTQRAEGLDRHSGQVSLPGGVIEPGESIEQAALRESHEETALAPAGVRTLGALTPIDIPVSGFRLHPVVAVVDERRDLEPADGEVARILEVPVEALMDPDGVAWRSIARDGGSFRFPAFLVGSVEIWGATAMVLAEFLVLLGWTGPRPDPARS